LRLVFAKMCQKLSPEECQKLKVEIKKAFDDFDTDKSGQIDAKEFENVLGKYNSSPECKKKMEPAKIKEIASQFIEVADKNADGKVNFNEFFKFLLEALNLKE